MGTDMAHAYPNSSFAGFDYHLPSIRHAQKVAANAGLAERCRFEVATATTYSGAGEQRLRQVASAAGFGRFRRVTQTPFYLVYEARSWPWSNSAGILWRVRQ